MKKILLLLLLSAAAITTIQAQMTWNFSAAAVTSGVPANITASSVTRGSNNGTTNFLANGTPASSVYTSATGGGNGNCSAKTGVLNTASTGSTYIQTVLTPAAGFWVSVTAVKWGNFSLSATGPTTLSVYASNDDFVTSSLLGTATVTYSTTVWTLVIPTVTPYNGLTGTTVTLRIFASGGTGTTPAAGAVNWRMDDLTITATAQTGTVGQIPKYTSPTTFGNSIITENSGNIGISTLTPAQKLDVAGGIKFSGLLVTGQATNPAGLAGQVLQSNGPVNPPTWVTGAAGTVTAIGVTTANGVSGTSSGGATPNLTISLGAITPSSVNASGTVLGSNLSGINTGDNAPNPLYSGLVSNANHTGDASGATVLTLATVNSNVGTFTNPTFTVNAKGLITAASSGAAPVTIETDPVVKAINGLVKSNGTTIAAAVAGTDYLLPNGSAAALTSFPILNQNTTGNAATATRATNIAGGVAGSIPYQASTSNTALTVAGTAGYLLTSGGAGAPTWTNPGTLSANSWSLSGNSLAPISTAFLGTTTNNDLVLKVNNIESGRLNDANSNTYFGVGAANNNAGNYSTAIGKMAGFENTGSNLTATGDFAAYQNTGVVVTAIGDGAGFGNTGYALTATGASSATYNRGTSLTATGEGAAAGNTGDYVTATGNAAAFSNEGYYTTATGNFAAFQNTGYGLTATGSESASGNTGSYATALGFKAGYSNANSNATAIGAFATVTADNAISLGSISGINGAYADVKVGIGTTAPSEKLHIQNGKIRIVDGTQGLGKLLTSDANGVATWQAPNTTATAWGLNGNNNTNATSFLGTTTNNDLVLKVNNIESGRLNDANSNTFFGVGAANGSTGNNTTAIGKSAAFGNTGAALTAIGEFAAYQNTGTVVTATGDGAGFGNTGSSLTATGVSAATYNTGVSLTATGMSSGSGNAGANVTATGNSAAASNTGSDLTATGYFSAFQNTGGASTATGYFAAYQNTGTSLTATGSQSGSGNTGHYATALGFKAGYSNTSNYSTAIGAFATVTVDNAISLGAISGINGAPADVNVGIGTTAPVAKLDVIGSVKITDGSEGTGKVLTSDADGLATWADLPAPTANAWGLHGNAGTNPADNFIGTTDGKDLIFKVNNLESGRINLVNSNTFFGLLAGKNSACSGSTLIGGAAGEGNTTPNLTAIGFACAYYNTGDYVTTIGNGSADGNSGHYLSAIGTLAGSSNSGNYVTVSGFNVAAFNTADYVTASGDSSAYQNTGYGLTATGSKSGSVNSGDYVTAIGYRAAFANTNSNATAIGAFATVTSDNAISLGGINGINGATADVNVGIGTTAPSEKLHIQNGKIKIVDGTQGAGKILTSDANGVASWQPAAFAKVSVSADNGLILSGSNIGLGSALNQATAITNNGFALTIAGTKAATTFSSDGNLFSSGKIAIGTTDLAQIGNYSLAVNGAAIFTKATVKLIGNWPDYVFEPTYKLTALKEVENFLKENKHLPGVQSAAEIQKNGIDLGENQAILLRKVEELTLYTIEANKKIEQQQAQIDVLLKQQQAITELQAELKKIKNK